MIFSVLLLSLASRIWGQGQTSEATDKAKEQTLELRTRPRNRPSSWGQGQGHAFEPEARTRPHILSSRPSSRNKTLVYADCKTSQTRSIATSKYGYMQWRTVVRSRQSIGWAQYCLWTLLCPSIALSVPNDGTPLATGTVLITAFTSISEHCKEIHTFGESFNFLITMLFEIPFPEIPFSVSLKLSGSAIMKWLKINIGRSG